MSLYIDVVFPRPAFYRIRQTSLYCNHFSGEQVSSQAKILTQQRSTAGKDKTGSVRTMLKIASQPPGFVDKGAGTGKHSPPVKKAKRDKQMSGGSKEVTQGAEAGGEKSVEASRVPNTGGGFAVR